MLGCVRVALATNNAPILARLSALEASDLAQTARDRAQDDALAFEAAGRKAADDAEALARQAVSAALATEAQTRSSADMAQAGRLGTLEARPEEAAHFIASAKLPAVALLADVPLALAVSPVKAGDVLKAGEDIVVEPGAALPAGVSIASARVTADNVVTLQLRTSIAVAAGTAPLIWSVVALR